MKTATFGFLFRRNPAGGPPSSHVTLDMQDHPGWPGDERLTFVSCECHSGAEFEREIDRLHSELEAIRRQAQSSYQSARR